MHARSCRQRAPCPRHGFCTSDAACPLHLSTWTRWLCPGSKVRALPLQTETARNGAHRRRVHADVARVVTDTEAVQIALCEARLAVLLAERGSAPVPAEGDRASRLAAHLETLRNAAPASVRFARTHSAVPPLAERSAPASSSDKCLDGLRYTHHYTVHNLQWHWSAPIRNGFMRLLFMNEHDSANAFDLTLGALRWVEQLLETEGLGLDAAESPTPLDAATAAAAPPLPRTDGTDIDTADLVAQIKAGRRAAAAAATSAAAGTGAGTTAAADSTTATTIPAAAAPLGDDGGVLLEPGTEMEHHTFFELVNPQILFESVRGGTGSVSSFMKRAQDARDVFHGRKKAEEVCKS